MLVKDSLLELFGLSIEDILFQFELGARCGVSTWLVMCYLISMAFKTEIADMPNCASCDSGLEETFHCWTMEEIQ